MRKGIFKLMEWYPYNLFINYDFNFNTTIFRGLKQNNMQSVKYLLEYLFNDINSFRYNRWILIDMNRLMDNNIGM